LSQKSDRNVAEVNKLRPRARKEDLFKGFFPHAAEGNRAAEGDFVNKQLITMDLRNGIAESFSGKQTEMKSPITGRPVNKL
jgi:hypothetical protein